MNKLMIGFMLLVSLGMGGCTVHVYHHDGGKSCHGKEQCGEKKCGEKNCGDKKCDGKGMKEGDECPYSSKKDK